MPRLRNVQTGEHIDVEDREEEEFLKSGYERTSAPEPEIYVDEEGRTISAPAGSLALQARAMHPETESERSDRTREAFLEEEYGSGLKTALEGGWSGATLGLSDFGSDSTAQYRARHKPGLRLGSEIVGNIATLGLTGVGGLATKAGARAFGTGIAGRIGARALGGVAEGSLVGAGHELSQVALSDEPLSAERIVTAIGRGLLEGGLVGGVAGGGLAGLGELGSATIRGVSRGASSVARMFPRRALTKSEEAVARTAVREAADDTLSLGPSLVRDADDLVSRTGYVTVDDAAAGASHRVLTAEAESVQAAARELSRAREALVKDLGRSIPKSGREVAADLSGEPIVSFKVTDEMVERMTPQQLRQFGDVYSKTQALRGQLESLGQKAYGEGVPVIGDASKKTLDRLAEMSTRTTKTADKGFDVGDLLGAAEAVGDIPGLSSIPFLGTILQLRSGLRLAKRLGLGKFVGELPGLSSKVATVADRTNDLTTRLLGGVSRGVAMAGDLASTVAKAGPTSAVQTLSRLRVSPGEPSYADRGPTDSLRRLRREADHVVSNPDAVRAHVASRVPEAQARMPGLVDAVTATIVRRAQHIQNVIPPDPRPESLGSRHRPAARTVEQVARVAEVLDDPNVLLERAIEGRTVHPDQVAAVRDVFPAFFADVQRRLLDGIHELREDLPYRVRAILSDIFDVPVEPSRDPAYVRIVQAPGPLSGEQDQSVGPTPTIDVASSYEGQGQLQDGRIS